MNPDARERLVASLSTTKQRILETLQDGPKTFTEMRAHVDRADGCSKELEHLRAVGLIRHCGHAPATSGLGMRPWIYELVPDDKIEEAAAAFKPRKRRRRKSAAGARLAEQHRLRKAGQQSQWGTLYLRVLQLTQALVFIDEDEMISWETATTDEVEQLRDAVIELREWCESALDTSVLRISDDQIREKIEKLRATNGRTGPEAAAFERMANKLEEKLQA